MCNRKPGTGTTVRMKIPLTLAIIPALIVTSGGDRYAIPQVSLLELVRLDGEARAKGHRAHPRSAGLPLARTAAAAGVSQSRTQSRRQSARHAQSDPAVNIVVLQADERQFGLVVDEINDTEEIVVKPLGKQLKGIKTFAGSTIMGDGRVALILDVLGVAQTSNVVAKAANARSATRKRHVAVHHRRTANDAAVPVRPGWPHGHGSLARGAARRSSSPRSVECAGDAQVVQYRGQIMPLLRVSEVLGRTAATAERRSGNGKRDLATRCKSSCIPRKAAASVWSSIGFSTSSKKPSSRSSPRSATACSAPR